MQRSDFRAVMAGGGGAVLPSSLQQKTAGLQASSPKCIIPDQPTTSERARLRHGHTGPGDRAGGCIRAAPGRGGRGGGPAGSGGLGLVRRRPDALPWLRREGTLLRPSDTPSTPSPWWAGWRPIPVPAGGFGALPLLASGVVQGGVTRAPYRTAMERMQRAMAAAIAGRQEPLSWMRLLGGDLADMGGRYRFVLAQPVLAHGALEAGGAAIKAKREAAAWLEFVRSGAARVRITGSVALSDEEFTTVARGAVLGMVISVTLIPLWLFIAVRSRGPLSRRAKARRMPGRVLDGTLSLDIILAFVLLAGVRARALKTLTCRE